MEPFVVNTAELQLSTADLRHFQDFKNWLWQKKVEAAQMPFRFLDLPAELRSGIYAFAFENEREDRIKISRFKQPPITQTSRLLRKEALPLFYSNSPFEILAFSNFEDRYIFRNRGDPNSIFYQDDQKSRIVKASGVLGVKQQVKASIRTAGADAVFRDVSIRVVEADPAHINAKNIAAKSWDGVTMSCISMEHLQGQNSVTVTNGLQYPPVSTFYNRGDVDEAIQGATDEAKSLASQSGFKGFTLKDLEKIVGKLRYIFQA